MKFEFLDAQELAKAKPKKVNSILFAYRQRLLVAARDNREVCQAVFDRRTEIADLFKEFGGDRHAESAQFFEELPDAEALLTAAPEKKTKAEEQVEKPYQPLGFYVLGPRLSREENKAVRMASRTGQKPGNQIPISIVQLFKLPDDKRPIFINQSDSDHLRRQLAVLIQVRPDLKTQLHFARWGVDGSFTAEACFRDQQALAVTLKEDQIEALTDYLNHVPKVGCLYRGRVTKIGEFGLFVEIMPGQTGLIHMSEVPNFDSLVELGEIGIGDEVVVEVTRHEVRYDHFFLSIKAAQESLSQGKKVQFSRQTEQLLLSS